MTPEDLNRLPDADLAARVDAIIAAHGPSVSAAKLAAQRLAPYIPFEILRRAHNVIAARIKLGVCKLAKQKVLAWFALELTGVPAPLDVRDVEKIGNLLDYNWLTRKYVEPLGKLRFIRDKGKREQQRIDLETQCCRITSVGGVESCTAAEHAAPRTAQKRPHVPYTQSTLPPPVSPLDLQEELNNTKRELASSQYDMRREQERVEPARAGCDKQKSRWLKARDAQNKSKAAIHAMKQEVKRVKLDGQKAQRAAAQELEANKGKLERLGGQVADAMRECARQSSLTAKFQQQCAEQQRRQAEAQQHAELEVAEAKARAEALWAERMADARQAAQQRKAAKAAQEAAAAQALRLGSQVTAAMQETGRMKQKAYALKHKLESSEATRQQAEEERAAAVHNAQVAAHARAVQERQRQAVKATSESRLEKMKALKAQVAELQDEIDELAALHKGMSGMDALRMQHEEGAAAVEKLRSMPTFRPVRSNGRGGGRKLEHGHRLCILEQHANGTPPAAIGKNIVNIVKRVAPWLEPVETTKGEICQIGYELTTVVETLSARAVADAFAVRLLGFDETSDLQEPFITSNVQIERTEGAELQDVVLKAAYLSTKGGTSEAIVAEIEGKCFERLRQLLRLHKQYHEKLFPNAPWSGPDESRCSLHRLAGGGALQSDTCNAARLAKRLLRNLIQHQAEVHLRKQLGDEVWEALSADEQAEQLRVHLLDCHQHMRNIWLSHMSAKQAAHAKAELTADLDSFAPWERVTTEYANLYRGIYKQFHKGGRYYKGKSLDFHSWMLEHYPDVFFMHVERADGGRQDLDYDAALPIYIDRIYFVEYLHTHVYGAKHANILEDSLFVCLCSEQFIAMTRANGIIDLRISRPHRWLAGKSSEISDWSPLKMNTVLDLVDDAFQKGRDDGRTLLDPAFDIFTPIAATQPLFHSYLKFTYEQDIVLSPNGKTRHLQYKLALAELLDPQDETNRRPSVLTKTIEYLQVQCAAGLEKMYDSKLAIADKLSSQDGVNSAKNSKDSDHTDLAGCHSTNDRPAESIFGAFKHHRRRLPSIGHRRAAGLAGSSVGKHLARPDAVQHRKSRLPADAQKIRKQQTSGTFGALHNLPYTEQVALVEMARAERGALRKQCHEDQQELDAFMAARRKSNSELELDSLIKQYALALSFFDRYSQRGVKSQQEVHLELQKIESTQGKLDWLREQIEMRVVGFGWVEFKSQWSSSSDETVGSVSDLKGQLKEILEEEADRELPKAAVAPIMQRKTFKQLGSPTAQAEQLASQRLSLSEDDMLEKAQAERKRLEALGELDTVGDQQPKRAPPLDEGLVGRKLEIHWRYWRPARPGEKGKKKQIYIWCEGTIVAVADGKIRKSARSKQALPAGAVRIRWPAYEAFEEPEKYEWCILNPEDWCKEVHLGWRWALSELVHIAEELTAQPPKKRQREE